MNSSVRSFRLRAAPMNRPRVVLEEPVSSEHYGQVIASSSRIFDADGTLLGVLLRDGLPLQSGGSMYRAISPILKAQARIKRLQSMDVGLWETNDSYAPTAFTSLYPRATERCSAALNHLSAVYKAYMPEAYGRQATLLQSAHNQRWALQGSVFTSLHLELNMGGTYTVDDEPPQLCARVLCCFRGGKAKLSHVVLPRLSLALTMDSLDVLLLRSDEPYGMTAIKPGPDPYERIIVDATLRGAHREQTA